MKFNWKMMLIILTVAIVAAVIILIYAFETEEKSPKTFEIEKISYPEATGDIDVLTNSLISDALSEKSEIQKDVSDILIIDWDSQAINNFGQSYENEF